MRKIEEKFDHFGNRVVVGDWVVVVPPWSRELVFVAKVVKLTPKGVNVYVEGSDYPDSKVGYHLSRKRRFNRSSFVKYERR